MSTTDYIISGILVLLVLRQIPEHRQALFNLILPVVLVAGAALYFLHSVPTIGHDLWLEIALVLLGAVLGGACALTTHVRAGSDGTVLERAGPIAALLWVVGVGSRIAFAYASTHGAGPAIAQFSQNNQITGAAAWTAAIVMMALAEVLVRLVVLRIRGHLVGASAASSPARLARS